MQLCFCIASVHKQHLNSALVDRYFLDKFNQTSVFLNHTFILSTLKECKYCQHASKSRLQRAYERWAPSLLQESSDQTVRSRRLRPSVYETIRIRTKLIDGGFALLKKNISSQNINKYHLKAFSNITTYLIF
jgi:hypothetical protein